MKYTQARELVETILDQLYEGLTPSKPKPKKFGFEDRMSKNEPKKKYSWQMTSDEQKKYFGNKDSKPVDSIREGERPQDTNWDRVNMDSRTHAQKELFPKRKPTSVDAHLPGGAAAALKRSRAAFARKLKEAIDQLDEATITEGAVKGLLNDMGYFFTDEGKHAGKWVHEKTGKALSDDHATKIAAERHARKKKSVGNKDSAARKRGNDDTESLLKKGFSRDHLRAIISGTGR